MKRPLRIAALGVTIALAGAAPAAAAGGWQAVRASSAIYHSVTKAAADGYSLDGEPCIQSPDGAMGIHAVNFELAGDLDIEPLRPEILLYFPDGNGQLELLGAEYFAVALANSDSGPIPWFGSEPPAAGWFNPAPTVLGQTFDGPMPGHNGEMPWHYDLHAWLWADNPDGTFAPFNPALACP